MPGVKGEAGETLCQYRGALTPMNNEGITPEVREKVLSNFREILTKYSTIVGEKIE